MSKKMNLLLLCSGEPSNHLVKAIKSKGHTFEVYKPQDLYLTISDGESGFDRIYDGNSSFEEPIRLKAKNYDAVISRIGDSLSHSATILRHLTENLGIYATQSPDGLETASNKLKTTQKLSYGGVQVPLTAYASNPIHIDFLINKVGGLPAIGKLLRGSQGKGVFILETPVAANTALESFSKLGASLKLQQFIKADGKDIDGTAWKKRFQS
jgi:ribosomal protein S6--L-glutamate ligase